jgi:hypothetical protein
MLVRVAPALATASLMRAGFRAGGGDDRGQPFCGAEDGRRHAARAGPRQ